MTDVAVLAEGLVKRFGSVQALDGLDLEAQRGTVLGVLGPNGAGKTTAVRILTTLLRADEGRAFVDGIDVRSEPDAVRRHIGLSGQYSAVDEYLTGRENLTIFGQLYHLGAAAARTRAAELLEQFSLTDAADRPVKTYSGGMRRRLDLAGALVARPPVIFLDEPTTGLDPRSRLEMWGVIEGLVASGVTLLLTTQYLDEADRLAHDIVVVDHGRVIARGSPTELKGTIGGERVEVTIVDATELPVVTEMLAAIGHDTPEVVVAERRVSVGTKEGATALVDVVRRLDEKGVQIADLKLTRPSLDDVFMSLTGHGAEESEEEVSS
ncbi:MAG TPA: ATP-binding cassette domain-containing protein [Actinomycetes bacterium]|nr:ATP-binding cassette domain-containing protein [Actinomycetes bacterium]